MWLSAIEANNVCNCYFYNSFFVYFLKFEVKVARCPGLCFSSPCFCFLHKKTSKSSLKTNVFDCFDLRLLVVIAES